MSPPENVLLEIGRLTVQLLTARRHPNTRIAWPFEVRA